MSSIDDATVPALFSLAPRSTTNHGEPPTSKKNKPLSKSEILKAIV